MLIPSIAAYYPDATEGRGLALNLNMIQRLI